MQLNIRQGILSNIWDSTNKKLMTNGTSVPQIINGNLYVGYDETDNRAMLFADFEGIRYPFAARVKWSDISNIPDLATQGDIDSIETTLDDNKKIYFSALSASGPNGFKLTTPTSKVNGGGEVAWTAKNYYPTAITWNGDAWTSTAASSIGTISMVNNGTLDNTLTIDIPSIPPATATTCGIVTVNNQNFTGIKNFTDAIALTNKIKLHYETSTESLDFTFL